MLHFIYCYAECHYTECHHAVIRLKQSCLQVTNTLAYSELILSVVMLSVVMPY